jgi:hypothetical protein
MKFQTPVRHSVVVELYDLSITHHLIPRSVQLAKWDVVREHVIPWICD